MITVREREIAELFVQGLSREEIAEYLNLSKFTVRDHLNVMKNKLNSKNLVQLGFYLRKEFKG